MLFSVLAFAAVVLTYAMFSSRNAMLGFPSAIMWAILGGYCYNESTVAWDIYFIFAFACLLGMTTFCALGAYGLREKRDTLGDESIERGDSNLVDEETEESSKSWYEDDGIPDASANKRPTQSRKERIAQGHSKRRRKGEFNF